MTNIEDNMDMYIAWVQVYCFENKPAREFGPLTRVFARVLGPNYHDFVRRAISLIPCDIRYRYSPFGFCRVPFGTCV